LLKLGRLLLQTLGFKVYQQKPNPLEKKTIGFFHVLNSGTDCTFAMSWEKLILGVPSFSGFTI